MDKLRKCLYYPYDIDLLIGAVNILKIPLNIEEYEAIIGSLIKNLRRCYDLVPGYSFRTYIFDSLLSYLNQRWRHLFLKVNNHFDRIDIKEIAADNMKRL